MKWLSLTTVIILGLLAFADALLFEKKGVSSIHQTKTSDGFVQSKITSQDYRVLETYSDAGVLSQLLDIRKQITTTEGMEGISGQLELTLYTSVSSRYDSRRWQIKEQATDWSFQYDPPMIITTLAGCCGALSGARAYDYSSGRLVMSYTPLIEELGAQESPFLIEIPNTSIFRLVGVLSADSSRDFPQELIGRDAQGYQAIAIVKYADQNKIQQKFVIKALVSETFSAGLGEVRWIIPPGSRNESRAGKATLWDIDGQPLASQISGLSLQVKIYGESGESYLRIPVTGDRFDLSRAEKPAGIVVVPL